VRGRPEVQQEGGIVTGWLFRIVLLLAVAAFLVFEIGAMAVNSIVAEDAARDIARGAATTYRGGGDIDAAADAGVAAARERGVRFVEIRVDGDILSVTVESTASTLVAHEIGALESFVVREATRSVEWR
jgi:hypothetical protein